MGQAKRRGTFEERKAQAIAAGRIKQKKKSDSQMLREVMPLVTARVFAGALALGTYRTVRR